MDRAHESTPTAARRDRRVQRGGAVAPASSTGPGVAPLHRLQRLAGNEATSALVVSRQTIDPATAAGGQQAGSGVGLQLPVLDAGATGATAAPAQVAEATPAPNTPPAAPAQRLLRRGSQGPDVAQLQTRLNEVGAAPVPLDPDGIFGGLTQNAVLSFQREHPPLAADGVVGPMTRERLDAEPGGGGGGTEPPGVEPPGVEPPGVEPPGVEPPGVEPPGVEPPVPATDPLLGICTIEGHGSSAAAVARAREQAVELYGGIAPANRARMEADPVTVDVIPHDKKLTDLPPYANLTGQTTFDGRIWDDVRGIRSTVDGRSRVAVAEEDLVAVPGKAASYGPGFLEAHEGGHGLQFSGLTPAQVTQLTALYTARLATHGQPTASTPEGPATAGWLSPAWYSAANKEEYFANSVAAYHAHPYSTSEHDREIYTPDWLSANDAPMYNFLQEIYARSGGTP
ncbi:putative peptidoglycan binding protein [Salana multivorans]|uniref:Putative peptidoglycan binding protein n=1 Tax=Salana multivorans TaxID=120377 RepID=A0A3N2D7B4_9MICO|nr:peptidoglycan-binding domain-containing protein [Salana multivorans]ROR95676.1 putative peptidoglycan binding protein [Salana multivorans]